MRIFIGSSQEQLDMAVKIGAWLEEKEHEPLVWDSNDLFPKGTYLLSSLIKISATVDLAVLIFGDDDKVWYREDKLSQPRDNVLLEYGLFAGVLGPERTLICRTANSKVPSDIDGIIRLEFKPYKENKARQEIHNWIRRHSKMDVDPVINELQKGLILANRKIDKLQDRLDFEEQSVRDLRNRDDTGEPRNAVVVDSLFSYNYFWETVEKIRKVSTSIAEMKTFFESSALGYLVEQIEIDQPENDQRIEFYAAKLLRLLRTNFPKDCLLLEEALNEKV